MVEVSSFTCSPPLRIASFSRGIICSKCATRAMQSAGPKSGDGVGSKAATAAIPKLKFVYFDGPWLGEAIRSTLKLGGFDFEDSRVRFEDFAALKPTLPFGSVPILIVDDTVVYSQSDAILRYAGKLTALYPEDIYDAMKVDEVMAGVQDLQNCVYSEKTEAGRKKGEAEGIPRYAGGLDKMYSMDERGPFLLGNRLTIADCKVSAIVEWIPTMRYVSQGCMDEYTHLQAANEAVLARLSEAQ